MAMVVTQNVKYKNIGFVKMSQVTALKPYTFKLNLLAYKKVVVINLKSQQNLHFYYHKYSITFL